LSCRAKAFLHTRHESVSSVDSVKTGATAATQYFEFYSRSVLVDALRGVLRHSLEPRPEAEDGPDLRPYRLIVTLLDKPEIGPVVIDDVMLDVFRTLYRFEHEEDVTLH
jgi:hypothetical protein